MSYSFSGLYRSKSHAKRGIDNSTGVPPEVKKLLHAAVDEMGVSEDRFIQIEATGHRDHTIKVHELYLSL